MKHPNGLFVSAAAVAIVLSSSVGIAQAEIALNGNASNGVTINGINLQGVAANGINLQGVAANGVTPAKHDKAARNRISVDPQIEVIGVNLSRN